MKKLFLLIAFLFISALSFAQQQVWVNSYIRSNGTYVQGHYRTAPDNTRNNNWTTQGNRNPHTGTYGTLPRDGYTSNRTSSPSYSVPTTTYNSSYSTPIYSEPSYNSTQTIYTGPRGGTYYINSNGNKTYVN